MELVLRPPRIERYTDRAGSVDFTPLRATAPREQPCYLPFHSAAVDVHGALKVCCHIYDSTDPAMQT